MTTVQDQIALTLGQDQWMFNIDELQLILEGDLGNSFLDLDRIENTHISPLVARLTTQALVDSNGEDLIRVEETYEPVTVGGFAIAPGGEVIDFSNLSS